MTKQGASDGVICYQHGDELWYNVPASKEHEKHGYVGDRHSIFLKCKDIVHIDGFEGKIDQVAGWKWQNACYKVTLGAGHPTPPPPENKMKQPATENGSGDSEKAVTENKKEEIKSSLENTVDKLKSVVNDLNDKTQVLYNIVNAADAQSKMT